jgi:hypothetical protein
MTEYTVTFSTPTAYAVTDIKAKTTKQALKKAHAFYDNDMTALDWYPYDADCKSLDTIEVTDDKNGDSTLWQSEDVTLKDAAPDLLDALTDLINQIDSLTGESSCIDEDIKHGEPYQKARAVIAKVKGGAA